MPSEHMFPSELCSSPKNSNPNGLGQKNKECNSPPALPLLPFPSLSTSFPKPRHCFNYSCRNYTGLSCGYCEQCNHTCSHQVHESYRLSAKYFPQKQFADNKRKQYNTNISFTKEEIQKDLIRCGSDQALRQRMQALLEKKSLKVILPIPSYAIHMRKKHLLPPLLRPLYQRNRKPKHLL